MQERSFQTAPRTESPLLPPAEQLSQSEQNPVSHSLRTWSVPRAVPSDSHTSHFIVPRRWDIGTVVYLHGKNEKAESVNNAFSSKLEAKVSNSRH